MSSKLQKCSRCGKTVIPETDEFIFTRFGRYVFHLACWKMGVSKDIGYDDKKDLK